MKKLNKILALVIVALLALTSLAALADDPAYDKDVTVTNVDKGDTVKFYKIVEWVGEADGNVKGWKAISPFDTVLTKAKLTEVLVGTPAVEADPENGIEAAAAIPATGITSDLAGELAKAAKTATAKATKTVGDDKIAKLDVTGEGLGEGIYMALITPADADTIYNPVFVSSDYNAGDNTFAATTGASYSDNAAAKKSTVNLDKTATTSEDNWDDKEWTTAAIGDTISFTVDTKIPAYGEVFDNPSFVIKDELEGLKLDAGSVKLTAPTGLTKGTDYTIVEADDGLSYTVNFMASYLKTVSETTAVKVEYTAKVTENSTLAVDWEKNEVSIEFSHNPSDQGDKKVKKDTTQHYKFTIDGLGGTEGSYLHGKKHSEVVKVGRDANGDPINETTEVSEITGTSTWTGPLAEAEFKLYTDAACTTEYHHKNADGTDAGAKVYKSDANGRIQIANLDAGTYYLKESKAPAGYIMDTTAKKIQIVAHTTNKSITEYYTVADDGTVSWFDEAGEGRTAYTYETDILTSYDVIIDGTTTSTFVFTNDGTDTEIEFIDEGTIELPSPFTNTEGVALPSTGGIGTTIFYIVGSILVLGAAILLVTKRRVNDR